MEILQGVLKQHLQPRAVVGCGVKIFLPSPPNYVTRSPGATDKNKDKDKDRKSDKQINYIFLQGHLFYHFKYNHFTTKFATKGSFKTF